MTQPPPSTPPAPPEGDKSPVDAATEGSPGEAGSSTAEGCWMAIFKLVFKIIGAFRQTR
jgi:hypothetical protein